jgi:hypothetical protein
MSDFMMAPHILHDRKYSDKGFPADGPMPVSRGTVKVCASLFKCQSSTGAQQSVQEVGLTAVTASSLVLVFDFQLVIHIPILTFVCLV